MMNKGENKTGFVPPAIYMLTNAKPNPCASISLDPINLHDE
jgi:hypothetical protein